MAAPLASTGSRTLDSIAQVIGLEAALKLSLRYRGNRIYVRKAYSDDHEIVALIGREAADKLADHFWDTEVNVPATAGLKAAAFRLADRGTLTRYEIADTLRITRPTLDRWLAQRAAADDRQADLFGPVSVDT